MQTMATEQIVGACRQYQHLCGRQAILRAVALAIQVAGLVALLVWHMAPGQRCRSELAQRHACIG